MSNLEFSADGGTLAVTTDGERKWWDLDGDFRCIQTEELATKRRESWRCGYIAGCDGAHGIVRERLSARYDGVTLKQD